MDSSAIMQNDAKVENVKAMTDFTREYGIYSTSGAREFEPPAAASVTSFPFRQTRNQTRPAWSLPGKRNSPQLPSITGDPDLVQRVWEEIDGLANMYIWQILLSF